MKHGRSKHVVSSTGFLATSQSAGLRVLILPLTISRQSTILFFTPRPHVVLHCGDASGAESRAPPIPAPHQERPPPSPPEGTAEHCPFPKPYPLPVLRQPVRRAVLVPAGMDGQRLRLQVALRLRHHAPVAGFAVHVPDHPALPAAAAALKPHRAQQAVSGGGSSTIPAPWMTQVGDPDACLGLSSSPAPPCQGILGVWIKKAANACCGEVGRVLPRGTPATNVPRSHPAVTKQNSAPPWHGQEEKCHKQGNLGRLSETKINGAKRVAASVPPSLLQPCPEPWGEQRMLPGSPAAALADTHGVLQPRCCHGNCLFLARE